MQLIGNAIAVGISRTEALEMTSNELTALIIAIGEAKGEEYDWDRGRWSKPK